MGVTWRRAVAASGLSPFPPCGRSKVGSALQPAVQPTRATRPTFTILTVSVSNAPVTCRSAENCGERQLPGPTNSHIRPRVVIRHHHGSSAVYRVEQSPNMTTHDALKFLAADSGPIFGRPYQHFLTNINCFPKVTSASSHPWQTKYRVKPSIPSVRSDNRILFPSSAQRLVQGDHVRCGAGLRQRERCLLIGEIAFGVERVA